ncbi:MAG: OmpA family protein [Deltaproteobacteria bacterium]|jgi:OOP family OmpA-OmpF porin|nr:OmpA family protein [Deltaproteobacteria bacterium]
MKSRFLTIVTPLLMVLFLVGGNSAAFGSTPPPAYTSAELTNRLKTGAYLQKTDNLMIIIDGQRESRWFSPRHREKQAQTFLHNIGNTIPNIPHSRMLRVFGPDAENYEKEFSTIFGLHHIEAKDFTPIIATKTLDISEFDPLGLTFISGSRDLQKLSGSHAVILLSDGVNIPKSALYESAYLKKKFGGSVCYYPILIGNDPQGAKNMSTIAKIGGCGFLAQYDAVDSPTELTDYVENVFFVKRRMPAMAVEPEVKPEPVVVVPAPVEIPEIIEEEPLEELEVMDDSIIILERQLPHDKVVTIELHIEFDLNQATLQPGYEDELKKVADFMSRHPETEALLEGHTCSLGSEEYNQQLSSRRAATVKNYLVNNFNIDPSRLKTRGMGESQPIADNSTEEGRMKNRRVMAVISTIVTDYVIVEQEILKSDFLREDFILPPVDQIIDEMLHEEDAEAAGETEIPAAEEVPAAPEVESMAPEAAPEPTSEVAQPEGSSASDQEAATKPATEDAVVVSPGESAFDVEEEEAVEEVEGSEEIISVPLPAQEEPATTSAEEDSRKATTEEDSLL